MKRDTEQLRTEGCALCWQAQVKQQREGRQIIVSGPSRSLPPLCCTPCQLRVTLSCWVNPQTHHRKSEKKNTHTYIFQSSLAQEPQPVLISQGEKAQGTILCEISLILFFLLPAAKLKEKLRALYSRNMCLFLMKMRSTWQQSEFLILPVSSGWGISFLEELEPFPERETIEREVWCVGDSGHPRACFLNARSELCTKSVHLGRVNSWLA